MGLPEPRTTVGAQALQAIIESPNDTLIGLDFDGTLAPIVDDPEQAYADPAAVAALGRLGERVGAVVVITGRPVRTAVRLGGFGDGGRARGDDGARPVRRGAVERRRRLLRAAAGAR